ncbi:MAG: hypothetical protein R3D45_16535 [Rhizobiaceae bacterium]
MSCFSTICRQTALATVLVVLAAVSAPALAASPASARDRSDVTRVYLLRGFLGVFSTGLDSIAADLEKRGIKARVTGHLQAGGVGAEIRKAYRQDPRSVRPLVLVGHSFGADAAMRLAKSLEHDGIRVDLVVTIDPTATGPVSGNVRRYVNYYLANNLIGHAVGGGKPAARVTNIDIGKRPEIIESGTGHWTMTTNRIIADEVLKLVARTVR